MQRQPTIRSCFYDLCATHQSVEIDVHLRFPRFNQSPKPRWYNPPAHSTPGSHLPQRNPFSMTRIATVSYLNALPLIDGVEREADIEMIRRVPSRLLDTLESGAAGLALCPVIDFQQSTHELEIVPAGAIGCDGPALTVKVFSRSPIETVEEIWVDGESHTSVALLRIVMESLYDRQPLLRPLKPDAERQSPGAVLLIGDKVVSATPGRELYPYELDLGSAWRELSGKPFVFATWMTRVRSELGDLPDRLDQIRRRNHERLSEIAARHAAAVGWPEELAIRYLSRNLRYELGEPELAGIEEFWARCHDCGIIEELKPMRLYEVGRES